MIGGTSDIWTSDMDGSSLTELGKVLLSNPWIIAAVIVGGNIWLHRTISRHESKCDQRWQKNWNLHESANTRISRLEGAPKTEQ